MTGLRTGSGWTVARADVAWGWVPFAMIKLVRSKQAIRLLHRSAWHKHSDGCPPSGEAVLNDAKGVFGGDRIAGRVVKYVDPGKSTKSESSHQGHTR